MTESRERIRRMYIIDGEKFTDKEFEEAMEAVKQINPVMAFCIEGMARYKEDEAHEVD